MAAYFKSGNCFEMMEKWVLAKNYYKPFFEKSQEGCVATNPEN